MMRIRIIGMALAALFAFSMIASASASAALPELVNSKGVEYEGTVKSKEAGKYLLEAKGGNTVTCTEQESSGKIVKPKKLSELVVTFKGCEASIGGIKAKCNTAKAAAGTIVTEKLSGEIGYISKAAKTVGQDLWPASRTKAEIEKHEFNASFVSFECTGFAKNSVKGGVIGELSPVNGALNKALTLTFAKGAGKGEQAVTKLEGVEAGTENFLQSSLNGGAFEKSNEQATGKAEFAEEVKLNG